MLSPWVDPTLRPILSAVPLGWSYTEAHPQCCPPGLVVHRGPWKTAPLEGREPRAAEAEVLSSTPGSPGSGAPVLLLLSDPLGRVRAQEQGPPSRALWPPRVAPASQGPGGAWRLGSSSVLAPRAPVMRCAHSCRPAGGAGPGGFLGASRGGSEGGRGLNTGARRDRDGAMMREERG